MNRFLNTLKTCNKTSDFYLHKPDIEDIKNMKNEIDMLNILIGAKDFDSALMSIVSDNPNIVRLFPLLVGTRDAKIDLLIDYEHTKPWVILEYDFKGIKIDSNYFKSLISFFENMGLKESFQNNEIIDVYSFILGMHLGLKTNARKNKSGTFMENYIEASIDNICTKNSLSYISQATSSDILNTFNLDVSNVLKNKRADFAINKDDRLILIETNFYNSSGSKIKSVTHEFIKFDRECGENVDFVWITDGAGWLKERNTLSIALNGIRHVININDLQNGYIEKLIHE